MRYLILFFTTLLLICSSCSNKNIYREFHEFDNYTWNRFDKITFTIPVDDEGVVADIILSVRLLDQFPYDEIPLSIIMKTSSGEERIIEKTIKLKDDKGEFIGSVAGSYWDVEEVLWKSFIFNNKGDYTIEIENYYPHPAMAAIVDIGLTVKKH